MIQKSRQCSPKPGRFILLSLFLHLAVILAFNYSAIFKPALHESPPYYVDIVSLPALEPAPASHEAPPPGPTPPAPPAAAVKPPPPVKPAMALPGKPSQPATTVPAPGQESREQEAREFAQRMGRLEHNADARHEAEALARVQKRAADKKSSGSASATGNDKGAEYGAYIQSRLKDALATTMVYRSKAPEAAVHLYIDKKGKLIRYVMERPSADKLFNDSVIRTIEKAKVNFPPPPTAAGYDKLYVFSPQEVTK